MNAYWNVTRLFHITTLISIIITTSYRNQTKINYDKLETFRIFSNYFIPKFICSLSQGIDWILMNAFKGGNFNIWSVLVVSQLLFNLHKQHAMIELKLAFFADDTSITLRVPTMEHLSN